MKQMKQMKQIIMKKKIIIAITLFLIFIGSLQIYFFIKSSDDQDFITIYGNVDIRDVNLSFRVFGRINEMKFEEGDHVNKNDVLSVLDKEPFEEEYSITEAELLEAQAYLTNAKKNYERQKKLVKTDFVSQKIYDKAVASLNEAKAKVNAAKTRVDRMETTLKDTEIKASANGTVLTRVREPGSIVSAGETVYTLALDENNWVRTFIDEKDLGNIYHGQKAKIYTDSRPNKPYNGQIGFISPQAEFTPKNVETKQLRSDLVYRIRVNIKDTDKYLKQGMPVTVKIDLKEKNNKDK